jgi:large-conductance mechanosensitive channel
MDGAAAGGAPGGAAAGAPSAAPAATATNRLNLAYHAIIGVAIGLIAPFTGFAWPVAILLGIVIGKSQVERLVGASVSTASQATRVLAVTGGVLAMLALGVFVGGLIAFLIVALAAFSERIAMGTSPTDQGIARTLIFVIGLVLWFVLVFVLRFGLQIRIGG